MSGEPVLPSLWQADKPGSVALVTQRSYHLSGMVVTGHLVRPTHTGIGPLAWAYGDEQPRIRCLFGLSAPKVYPAPFVANRAVGSYPTFSPLPRLKSESVKVCIVNYPDITLGYFVWRRSSGTHAFVLSLFNLGGLFSVTLAVNSSFPSCCLPVRK